jgi:hypothetical protein
LSVALLPDGSFFAVGIIASSLRRSETYYGSLRVIEYPPDGDPPQILFGKNLGSQPGHPRCTGHPIIHQPLQPFPISYLTTVLPPAPAPESVDDNASTAVAFGQQVRSPASTKAADAAFQSLALASEPLPQTPSSPTFAGFTTSTPISAAALPTLLPIGTVSQSTAVARLSGGGDEARSTNDVITQAEELDRLLVLANDGSQHE